MSAFSDSISIRLARGACVRLRCDIAVAKPTSDGIEVFPLEKGTQGCVIATMPFTVVFDGNRRVQWHHSVDISNEVEALWITETWTRDEQKEKEDRLKTS